MWIKWLIFAAIFIFIPFAIGCAIVQIKKRNKLTDEQQKNLNLNMGKYMLFYWLCDLFYMSFIIENIICKYIFGGLIMLIVFYNLSGAVVNQSSQAKNAVLKWSLLQDFIVGVGISVYLIYIIPNEVLQTIVIAIVAALYGGLFTLVGVAWTIRKGDADRQSDLQRIEAERKEEERKKHIPYIKNVLKGSVQYYAEAEIYEVFDINSDEKRLTLDKKVFYSLTINTFAIQNISNSNIVLKGIIFANNYYPFSKSIILTKDEICAIHTTKNCEIVLANSEKYLTMIVSDIIGNEYEIKCDIAYKPENHMIATFTEGNYTGFRYSCTIDNIGFPILKG